MIELEARIVSRFLLLLSSLCVRGGFQGGGRGGGGAGRRKWRLSNDEIFRGRKEEEKGKG